MVYHFECEAVKSYTEYLKLVRDKVIEDVHAPEIAIKYYRMKSNARLSDLIIKVREDEQKHAEVNKRYAQ